MQQNATRECENKENIQSRYHCLSCSTWNVAITVDISVIFFDKWTLYNYLSRSIRPNGGGILTKIQWYIPYIKYIRCSLLTYRARATQKLEQKWNLQTSGLIDRLLWKLDISPYYHHSKPFRTADNTEMNVYIWYKQSAFRVYLFSYLWVQ